MKKSNFKYEYVGKKDKDAITRILKLQKRNNNFYKFEQEFKVILRLLSYWLPQFEKNIKTAGKIKTDWWTLVPTAGSLSNYFSMAFEIIKSNDKVTFIIDMKKKQIVSIILDKKVFILNDFHGYVIKLIKFVSLVEKTEQIMAEYKHYYNYRKKQLKNRKKRIPTST